jgi:hypothetical protein
MTLDLVADPVGALGGMTGKGATRVLGNPNQNLLETVVREAVQNSWDARRGDSPVTFGIKAFKFSKSQREAIADALAEGTARTPPVLQLPGSREEFDAVVIYDRGTRGLRGRPSADASDEKDGDFARFVFSIGETKPRDGFHVAGGTYGFGRSAFLKASALGTILVHSRCVSIGSSKGERRFIGMNWRNPYELRPKRKKFTGRHWWGRADGDGIAPITGKAADDLAESFGMTEIPDDDFGTTILILQPQWSMSDGSEESDTEEVDERAEALSRMKQGLLWYVWPRVLEGSLNLEIDWFGESIEIPHPSKHPRLKLFARALEVAEKKREPRPGELLSSIECQRPIQVLGALGVVHRAHLGTADDDYLDPSEPLHHVALMRDTRLVVEYLPCAVPLERSEYAGVFLADREVNPVFAAAEPPTHDSWVKEQLPTRRERVLVNVALKKIASETREFVNPATEIADGSGAGLGAIADELGTLIPETTGGSVLGIPKPKGGGGGGGKGPRGTRLPAGGRIRLGLAQYREDEGRHLLDIPFDVEAGEVATTVEARVRVVVEGGGTEEEAPEGTDSPEVVGWRIDGTNRMRLGSELKVPANKQVTGSLIVRHPADCSVRVAVSGV